MESNDACVDYCVPENIDWGTAVTGIRDDDAVTKPVRIELGSWNEPNVTRGESAETLDLEIEVSSLTVGASYLLLRYNDYTKVPTRNFSEENAVVAMSFTAESETEIFSDTVLSSDIAIFRCVPD